MAFCSNCGAKLADGARFCTECGAPQQAPKQEPVYTAAPVISETPVQNPVQSQTTETAYRAPARRSSRRAPKKSPLPKILIILGICLTLTVAAVLAVVFFVVPKLGDILPGSESGTVSTWRAVTGSLNGTDYDADQLYPGGFVLELKKNGKCKLKVGEVEADGKWTDNGSGIHVTGGGIDSDGTMDEERLTLDKVSDMGIALTFRREDGRPQGDTSLPMGKFYIYSMKTDGVEYDHELLAANNMTDGYLLISSDGVGQIKFSGAEPYDLTWKDGKLFYGGTELKSSYDGTYIVVDLGDSVMTYSTVDEEPATTPATTPAAAAEITAPSQWYGWRKDSGFWGCDEPDSMEDMTLIIDTDKDTGRLFIEAFGMEGKEHAFLSMYVSQPDTTHLIGEIGEKDAWVADTYLEAAGGQTYELALQENGTLTMDFDFASGSGEYGCLMEFCFRPDGELWDEENDELPQGYAAYKAKLNGEPEPAPSTDPAPADKPTAEGFKTDWLLWPDFEVWGWEDKEKAVLTKDEIVRTVIAGFTDVKTGAFAPTEDWEEAISRVSALLGNVNLQEGSWRDNALNSYPSRSMTYMDGDNLCTVTIARMDEQTLFFASSTMSMFAGELTASNWTDKLKLEYAEEAVPAWLAYMPPEELGRILEGVWVFAGDDPTEEPVLRYITQDGRVFMDTEYAYTGEAPEDAPCCQWMVTDGVPVYVDVDMDGSGDDLLYEMNVSGDGTELMIQWGEDDISRFISVKSRRAAGYLEGTTYDYLYAGPRTGSMTLADESNLADGTFTVNVERLAMVGSENRYMIAKYGLTNADFDDDYELVKISDEDFKLTAFVKEGTEYATLGSNEEGLIIPYACTAEEFLTQLREKGSMLVTYTMAEGCLVTVEEQYVP